MVDYRQLQLARWIRLNLDQCSEVLEERNSIFYHDLDSMEMEVEEELERAMQS